jgi:hypothetical protein
MLRAIIVGLVGLCLACPVTPTPPVPCDIGAVELQTDK